LKKKEKISDYDLFSTETKSLEKSENFLDNGCCKDGLKINKRILVKEDGRYLIYYDF
jgi:hypothetical protein